MHDPHLKQMEEQEEGFHPFERARAPGVPCGLMNIGNTCYVNSLLQTLFHIQAFRDEILKFRSPDEKKEQVCCGSASRAFELPPREPATNPTPGVVQQTQTDVTTELSLKDLKQHHGHCLAAELRRLFAYSLLTARSCMNPSRLLDELVDPAGQKIAVGGQEDVVEFMLKFLDQLDAGLRVSNHEPEIEDSNQINSINSSDSEHRTLDDAVSADVKSKGQQLSILQSLFFGRQLQVFSYREQTPSHETNITSSPVNTPTATDEALCCKSDDAIAKQSSNSADPKCENEDTRLENTCSTTPQQGEVDDKQTEPLGDSLSSTKQQAGSAQASEQLDNLVIKEELNEFLQVFLDVKHGDLYAAWKATNRMEVDYTTPSGTKTRGLMNVWIERLPKLLFFQLQRVTYDATLKAQVKLNDAFEFDDTIYVDRFLHEKKLLAASAEERHRSLQQELSSITQALYKFNNYPLFSDKQTSDDQLEAKDQATDRIASERLSVDNLLSSAAFCLEANLACLSPTTSLTEPIKQKHVLHPNRATTDWSQFLTAGSECTVAETRQTFQALVAEASALTVGGFASSNSGTIGTDVALSLIRGLAAVCKQRRQQLEAEVIRLQKELSTVHDTLTEHAYKLFAIWLHHGQDSDARSGHYTAYIRSENNNEWFCFSDSQVSVVSFAHVKAVAVGSNNNSQLKVQNQHDGELGSNSSAYVLVYMEAALFDTQFGTRAKGSETVISKPDTGKEIVSGSSPANVNTTATRAMIPADLLCEIKADNECLHAQRGNWQEQTAQKELRCHAEAVFQDYAGLMHGWQSQKVHGDTSGNPCDPNGQKVLNDPSLLSFEVFLYRLRGEQEVWTFLLGKSVDSQRSIRCWAPADEGNILRYLASTLQNQDCYGGMLREKGFSPDSPTSQSSPSLNSHTSSPSKLNRDTSGEYELLKLDMTQLSAKYESVLVQAFMVDEALQALQLDNSRLPETVGLLARIWSTWDLGSEYKFRQNEVLLLMSVLIYNTIHGIEHLKNLALVRTLEPVRETCEFFFILLSCVEWPQSWKSPLRAKVLSLFPHVQTWLSGSLADFRVAITGCTSTSGEHTMAMLSPPEQKQFLLLQPLALSDVRSIEDFESQRPEPSAAFFDRHRTLFSWLMQNSEETAREYVRKQNTPK